MIRLDRSFLFVSKFVHNNKTPVNPIASANSSLATIPLSSAGCEFVNINII